MAKIGEYKITLHNACTDESCYWHTSHWSNIFSSGCYKLTDAKYCDKEKHYCTISEGLKREGSILNKEK